MTPLRRVLLVLALLLLPAVRAEAQSSYEQLNALSEVLTYVRLNYADSVAYPDLIRAAIDGVLRSLDPHSYFLRRADYARQQAFERGELAILGIGLEEVDGLPTVVRTLQGGPADRGGLLPGDRLLAVNDTSTAGLTPGELDLHLSGERGSRVRLRLARGPLLEPDTFSVELKREILPLRGVTLSGMVDSVTGYVRLSEFTLTAGDEVDRALKTLRGLGMRRAVLDLRGNGGGRVFGAFDASALFLPKDAVIFRVRPRHGDEQKTVAPRDGAWRTLPLIVLIDDMTASASEVLVGALQDNDRAAVVGRRSFGKALIQQPFVLQTGDVVFLTIAHVLTPGGRSIQRRYEGVGREQYYALRGSAGAPSDTVTLFHTLAGRPVRGGGGIAPDIEVAAPPGPPAWWSVAADSAFDTAVADSVAHTLPATPETARRWMTDTAAWNSLLLTPYLDRVRSRLHIAAVLTPAQSSRIAQILAARAAEVRWGTDAGNTLRMRNDADLQTALGNFPRLPTLLAPVRP